MKLCIGHCKILHVFVMRIYNSKFYSLYPLPTELYIIHLNWTMFQQIEKRVRKPNWLTYTYKKTKKCTLRSLGSLSSIKALKFHWLIFALEHKPHICGYPLIYLVLVLSIEYVTAYLSIVAYYSLTHPHIKELYNLLQ